MGRDYRAIYAARLKTALEGYSQNWLARKTGLSATTISAYVNGKKMPRLDIAAEIADALNVSLDWMLGRENQKESADQKDSAPN